MTSLNYTASTNFTLSECVLPPDTSTMGVKYVIIVLTIIVIIIAVIGNILILLVVYRNPSMHTFTNILIFSCGLSDILRTQAGVFRILYKILPHTTWFLSMFKCKLFNFFMFASLAATNIGLSFIALDRYFLVVHTKKRVFTKHTLFFVLPVIWLVAFAFASPAIFSMEIITYPGLGRKCVEQWPSIFDPDESPKRFTVVLFVFLYMLPLLSMTILYTYIAKELFKLIRNRQNSIELNYRQSDDTKGAHAQQSTRFKVIDSIFKSSNDHTSSDNNDNETDHMTRMINSLRTNPGNTQKLRVIKMLISIVIAFAVSWIPIFTLQFLFLFNSQIIACPTLLPHWLSEFADFIHYSNSALNPFLYFGFSVTFKKGMIALFKNFSVCIKKHSI